jgi:hypothetical protein
MSVFDCALQRYTFKANCRINGDTTFQALSDLVLISCRGGPME